MTWIASYQGFTVDGNTPTTSDEIYLNPGETKSISFKYRNDGTDTWSNSGSNPVRLGTSNSQNRASGFADNGSGGLNSGWRSITSYPKSRIDMVESSVAPGNYAHFTADFRGTPEASNVYGEGFQPLAESLTWMDSSRTLNCDLRPIATTMFLWYTKDGYHWESPQAPTNRTTDIPKLSGGSVVSVPDGWYSSMDYDVIYRQLELMTECGFNLILLEYEGHGGLQDEAAQRVIDTIKSDFPHMRYCFFTSNPTEFDYLYTFRNDGRYAWWDGKPLLCTWGHSSTSDSRFTIPSMGSNDTSMTWHWEVLPLTGAPSVIQGSAGTVIARYDDRVCAGTWGKSSVQHYNEDFTGSLFSDQFNTVKTAWNNRTIRIAFFNAWNEYHERQSNIEPHEDISIDGPTVDRNSAVNSNTYIYDITQGYINQLKA